MPELAKLTQQVEQLFARMDNLSDEIQISGKQVRVGTGLSEISERMGLFRAGEFRAGNEVIPGEGFSGMRMGYPGFTYSGEVWNLVGVKNDTLQVGIRASDGKFLAGGGIAILDENGLGLHIPEGGASIPANLSWYDSDGNAFIRTFNAFTETTGQFLLIAGPGTSTFDYHVLQIEARGGDTRPFIALTGIATISSIVLDNEDNVVEILQTETVFNQGGADIDFRVEGVGQANALFVQGSDGNVGIRRALPDSAFHIKAGTSGMVGSHYAGQLIIQSPIDSVITGNVVITGYESDGDGNPDQQLWYLGSSSSSNSDIIFLNRRNSNLVLGTNNSHRITISGDEIKVADWIRHTSASYRRYFHLTVGGFDPGASGATWVNPDANTTGGWQLNAVGETLIAGTDIHADWDGASDIMVEISFALNASGSPNDTVDLKLVAYYNGVGDTATKTQTVEVATVTDGTQYKVYKAVFTIDHDKADNVVDVGDEITFILNLETDTSEIDDVIITSGSFYYNTTHLGIESGDV